MHSILHNKHSTGLFMTPKLIEHSIFHIPMFYNKRRFRAFTMFAARDRYHTEKAALDRAISQSKIVLPQ